MINSTNQNASEHEKLVSKLNDEDFLLAYKQKVYAYKPSLFANIISKIMVMSGTLVYGEAPSYLKFRVLEIVARAPYQSLEVATYAMLTIFFKHEARAIKLSEIANFSRIAQDNEAMHLVVISHLAKLEQSANWLLHTTIPIMFAFANTFFSYFLYLASPKSVLELNYIIEKHAFEQYDEFIKNNERILKDKKCDSEFLKWYGRQCDNQYAFFKSVRNDELIHGFRSLEAINNL